MENHVTKFAFVHELTAFWTLEEVFFFVMWQLFVIRRVSFSRSHCHRVPGKRLAAEHPGFHWIRSACSMRATAAPDPFPYYTGSANQQEEGMRITSWIVTLLAAAVLPALAQEETLKDIEHGAKKAGEKIKEGVETVAEKTKETGETVAKGVKKAWRETKAYASGNRATYRKGARQKLNQLSREIADLKTRKSEAADPAAFDRQLETLSQQQATAKEQLDTMRKATSDQDYSEARKQFDTAIGEMEDGVAQARKQLHTSE